MAAWSLDRPDAAAATSESSFASPGRRTLTRDLPPSRPAAAAADSSAPSIQRSAAPIVDAIQLRAMLDAAGRPDLHAPAAHATSGSAGPLPYLDTIQASFGRHGVGHVQAHTDGAAVAGTQAMGAEAFASGDHVAFGRAPDLHTAAHEAAHVVQQRAGVQLKGGVGEVGDVYEQHADAVADAVVAGHSAEPLLDRYAGAPGFAGTAPAGAGAVQCKWLEHRGQTPYLRWDPPVNGLRWYLEPSSGNMFFQIESSPGVPEPQLRAIEALEGPAHARSVELWCSSTKLFEPSQAEPVPVEPSAVKLGPTTARGVPIARVGFGTDIDISDEDKARLDPSLHGAAQHKLAYGTLSAALGTGYTVFDTAHDYGTLGALGEAIFDAKVNPVDVFVIYKIKPSEVKTKFGGSLRAAVERATKELGRRYLDVLMLHDMEAPDGELEALAREMKLLVASGAVRYLGLSNVTSAAQIDLCARQGSQEISIRFLENKMHPHRQDEAMRREADARGMTYIGYSIMGSGNSTGKCGHVVSTEPAYDVRKDPALGRLATTEHMDGGASELALAWAVQQGTVQVPKTSSEERMRANRRAGTKPVSQGTVAEIGKMDDVITDDDQEALLAGIGVPKNQLKLAILNKSRWKMIDRVHATALGPTLDAIGGVIDGRADVKEAFEELLVYIGMIDDGDCQSKAFFEELQVRLAPGDYSNIVTAFTTGPRIGILTSWWANAKKGGGCPRARTRVMGYIASGLPVDYDSQLDASATVAKVAKTTEVELSDISEKYPADLSTAKTASAVEPDTCYGKLAGKMISFEVVRILGTRITIKIGEEL